jgi:hypothetical protein
MFLKTAWAPTHFGQYIIWNLFQLLRELGGRGVDSIHLAQVTDQWRVLVNTAVKLGFHKMMGISCVAEQLLASKEGLSSMELV